MRIKYDLHIHSGLSPCGDDDMTPVNIVGYACLNGLNMVAVCDHNSILNVEVAMSAGEAYGVIVVPAIELQTTEDIHLVCYFDSFKNLKDFYDTLKFMPYENRPEIFGHQYVYDEDDNIVKVEKSMLLASALISADKVMKSVKKFNGVAVPAHIDREANSMLQILGVITEEFLSIELSTKADSAMVEKWKKDKRVLINSDAHTLQDIGKSSEIELPENSAKAIINYLSGN